MPMKVCILFILLSTIIVANIVPNYRRQLVPKTLAQKLCEQDSTLTICSLPEVTPPRNPVSIWKTCEHQPHILLCQFKPPAILSMYKIVDVTTGKPERVEVIEVEEQDKNPRRILMERKIFKEKVRRQTIKEEAFDDSIMMGNSDIFDRIRLI